MAGTGKAASKQIGALWKHDAKNGGVGAYLKGTLDLGALGKIPIVIFKNDRKEKDNQPDYRIVLSEPAAFGGRGQASKRASDQSREQS